MLSGLGSGWIHALGVPGDVATVLSVTTMTGQGLDHVAAALQLGLPPGLFERVLREVGSAATVLVAAYAILRGRAGSPHAALRATALAVGVATVLAPSVHLWYLLWPLPFVAALRLRRRSSQALVVTLVIGGLVAPLDNSWHGVYLAIIGGIAVIVLILGVLLVTRPRVRVDGAAAL